MIKIQINKVIFKNTARKAKKSTLDGKYIKNPSK
jgi:hypothetical protein